MLPQGYKYCSRNPVTSAPSDYRVTFMGINRPSQALRAMIKGLKEAAQRQTFAIDMGTFGKYDEQHDVCYGCAATCALMELTHDPRLVKTLFLKTQTERSPGYILDHDYHGADQFEGVIDELRSGYVWSLFSFFKMASRAITTVHDLPTLCNATWQDDIGEYEKLADVWEQHGL